MMIFWTIKKRSDDITKTKFLKLWDRLVYQKKIQKNKIKYVRIYKYCYAPMTSTLEWLTSVFPAVVNGS